MILRFASLVVFCFLVPALGFATNFLDPRDGVYRLFDAWHARGIVDVLPTFRPFSAQDVDAILKAVKSSDRASRQDRESADRLLQTLAKGFGAGFGASARMTEASAGEILNMFGTYQGLVSSDISVLFREDFHLVNLGSSLVPTTSGNPDDFIVDWTSVDLGGVNWQVRHLATSNVSFGPSDRGLQWNVGYSRHSLGPITDDGLIVGTSSVATAHLGFRFREQGFVYEQYLFPLQSLYNDGTSGPADKYLYYHGITWNTSPDLNLSFFEALVGGGRLDPLYFVPLSIYFSDQGLSGYGDNANMGFFGQWRVSPGLQVAAVLFLDDLHFNEIAKLQFDTKWKMAGQASVLWAGDKDTPGWAPSLSLDYTAVAPYAYTHINSRGNSSPNYEIYSNGSGNLGPALDPNSDRLRFRAQWADSFFAFGLIRHGNASAGIIPGADGRLDDPGYLSGSPTFQSPFVDPTGQPYTRFLTQETLEGRLQFSTGWTPRFDLPLGPSLTASTSATAEFIQNENLTRGSFGLHLYFSTQVGLEW